MHRAWRPMAALALGWLTAAQPSWGGGPQQAQFKQGQEVQAQRPDGTWQQAIIDGKPDAKGYPVQFLEEPYGGAVLPPERIRLDPAKGTLEEQLARAFPEIPKWTGLLVIDKKDGRPHWAHLTAQHGSILKIAWDDRKGRQKIEHKDILEQAPPAPDRVYEAEARREMARHAVERRRHRPPPDLSIGYHVLALDNDDGEWYHARIVYKSGDAYMISWEDGVDPDEYRVGYELREP
jgi:hypothetical protein